MRRGTPEDGLGCLYQSFSYKAACLSVENCLRQIHALTARTLFSHLLLPWYTLDNDEPELAFPLSRQAVKRAEEARIKLNELTEEYKQENFEDVRRKLDRAATLFAADAPIADKVSGWDMLLHNPLNERHVKLAALKSQIKALSLEIAKCPARGRGKAARCLYLVEDCEEYVWMIVYTILSFVAPCLDSFLTFSNLQMPLLGHIRQLDFLAFLEKKGRVCVATPWHVDQWCEDGPTPTEHLLHYPAPAYLKQMSISVQKPKEVTIELSSTGCAASAHSSSSMSDDEESKFQPLVYPAGSMNFNAFWHLWLTAPNCIVERAGMADSVLNTMSSLFVPRADTHRTHEQEATFSAFNAETKQVEAMSFEQEDFARIKKRFKEW
jgi:hypothetical protein